MASCRSMHLLLLLLASATLAAFSGKIAGYWGQDGDEGQLDRFCAASTYDIIIVSYAAFPASFGVIENHWKPRVYDDSWSPHLLVGSHIQACQDMGKQVLLHLVSQTDTTFKVIDDALRLLGSFGPVRSRGHIERPFGEVLVNGFLFDSSMDGDLFAALATQIKTFAPSMTLAAQQFCDDSLDMTRGIFQSGAIDFVFVKFWLMDHACNVKLAFHWDSWSQAVKNSLNPNTKGYVEILGSEDKRFSFLNGYMDPADVWDKYPQLANDEAFAGFAISGISPGKVAKNFSSQIRALV